MKNILLILFLINFQFSEAQDLKSETEKMYAASLSKDYETMLAITYPKIFDIIPKENLLEVFQKMFENEDFNIDFIALPPNFKYSDVITVENKKVCKITHDMGMTMKFNKELDEETIKMTIEMLKMNENYPDVTFDYSKNSFVVKGSSTMIGINDEISSNKWTFLTYDKNKRSMFVEFLLSETIMKALKL